jgi:hypothetical protein
MPAPAPPDLLDVAEAPELLHHARVGGGRGRFGGGVATPPRVDAHAAPARPKVGREGLGEETRPGMSSATGSPVRFMCAERGVRFTHIGPLSSGSGVTPRTRPRTIGSPRWSSWPGRNRKRRWPGRHGSASRCRRRSAVVVRTNSGRYGCPCCRRRPRPSGSTSSAVTGPSGSFFDSCSRSRDGELGEPGRTRQGQAHVRLGVPWDRARRATRTTSPNRSAGWPFLVGPMDLAPGPG